jgi:transposase
MKPYTSDFEEMMRSFYDTLSEKDRRRYAAVETKRLARGGQAYIAGLLGCSEKTIQRGLTEFEGGLQDDDPDRVRREGGGRKPYEQTHPNIDEKFLEVLKDHTAGDPTDEQLKWTDLTQAEIAEHLREDHGVDVSVKVVRQLLEKHGFHRRKSQKNSPMKHVAHRNEQFEKIARLKADYQARGEPVISMDTKYKEQIGNFYREGKLYAREPLEVFDHDFNSFAEGVVIPHGIYDLARNTGYLHLGTSHDTSEFACDHLQDWWTGYGRWHYPQATSILILCDGGGSNSSRYYIFKQQLQTLADRIGIEIRLAHYPPYCSKYNPIEHKLFPHVTRACKGVVFKSVELVKELMEKTHTKKGLNVFVEVVRKTYQTGRKVAKGFKENMRIAFDQHLPQWNYRAIPATAQKETVI